MNKRRPPGSFEAAIATVIERIGAAAAAAALSKSEALVYKASDPEVQYMLTLDQGDALNQAWDDTGQDGVPPILATMMSRLSADADIPIGRFQSVKDELLDLPEVNAGFVAAVLKAHRLGDMSPNVKHEVLAMLDEFIRELREVVYALEHECGATARAAE